MDPNAPWPQFAGSNGYRQSMITAPANLGTPRWRAQLNRGVIYSSSAVSSAGTLAICAGDVFSLSCANGTTLWTFPGLGCTSTPALSLAGAVIAAGEGGVVSLESATGKLLWTFLGSDAPFTMPTLGAVGSDTLYVGSMDGCLYKLSASTGAPVWSTCRMGGTVEHAVALTRFRGVDLILASLLEGGTLLAMDAATGSRVWAHATGDLLSATPTISATGDAVIVGSFTGEVLALSLESGEVQWKFNTGGAVHAMAAVAVGGKGDVIIGSGNGTCFCLEGATGGLLWSHTVGSPIRSSAAVAADGMVIFGSDSGAVTALRPPLVRSGGMPAVSWTALTGGQVYSSPSIGVDGTAYVASYDGSVWAFGGGGAANAVAGGATVSSVIVAVCTTVAVLSVAAFFTRWFTLHLRKRDGVGKRTWGDLLVQGFARARNSWSALFVQQAAAGGPGHPLFLTDSYMLLASDGPKRPFDNEQ